MKAPQGALKPLIPFKSGVSRRPDRSDFRRQIPFQLLFRFNNGCAFNYKFVWIFLYKGFESVNVCTITPPCFSFFIVIGATGSKFKISTLAGFLFAAVLVHPRLFY